MQITPCNNSKAELRNSALRKYPEYSVELKESTRIASYVEFLTELHEKNTLEK
jgi:hypothetical protein